MPVVWISVAVALFLAVEASIDPIVDLAAISKIENQLVTSKRYGKWRKYMLRMQTPVATMVQFFASFAIILLVTLVFVQNHQMKSADVGFETDNIYVSQLQKSNFTCYDFCG